jgi:hypothetical protein
MALYSLKTSNHDIDRSRGDDDATKFSIQEIGAALEAKLPQLQAAPARGLDFTEVERALQLEKASVSRTRWETRCHKVLLRR